MSALPSTLKSPVPTICQLVSASVGGVRNVPLDRLAPSMNQTTFWPETACRHRMSALPSELKSLVPTIRQFVSGRVDGFVKVPLRRRAPSMYQSDDLARGRVPPQDVGEAVPAEVGPARRIEDPRRGRGLDDGRTAAPRQRHHERLHPLHQRVGVHGHVDGLGGRAGAKVRMPELAT